MPEWLHFSIKKGFIHFYGTPSEEDFLDTFGRNKKKGVLKIQIRDRKDFILKEFDIEILKEDENRENILLQE